MGNKPAILFLILIVSFIADVRAVVLFEDYFSNESQSILNWTGVINNGGSIGYGGGCAAIDNSGSVNSAMAIHNMPLKPPDFTFSGRVVTDDPGAGIIFCLSRSSVGTSGYAVVTGEGGVYAYKYSPGEISELHSESSPFVRKKDNLISVSKKKERMTVFCNGYFVFTFIDSAYNTGDIGLLVQPYTSADFDDIQFREETYDSTRYACFSDDFSVPGNYGWIFSGSGKLEREEGFLGIVTSTHQKAYYGLHIPLTDFTLKTDVSFSGGDSSILCGFFVLSDSVRQFFCINRRGECASYSDGGDTVTGYLDKAGPDGWNNLELNKESDSLIFSVNGTIMGKADGKSLYEEAGLFVSSGAAVMFDNFRLTDPLGCNNVTAVRVYRQISGVQESIAGLNADMLGRKLLSGKASMLLVKTGKSGSHKRMRLRAFGARSID
ncbi:MAG: hypothetical protein GX556_09130 [Fibrobacter sp.]|nr:hypothetical protein [Fibrobacter sp.]